MEAPHQLGTGRGIRPSQSSVICGMDHEFSEHNNIIKPVQPEPAEFCQALVVLGWASSAETHPSRDFSLASDKPTAPLDLVLEEEVAADYHQQGDGSSQMPGQTEEAMPTALLGHHNGASRAEGHQPSNEDLVLHTNRAPPPAWPPLFLLPSREMGKLAALRLTTEQRAPKPQSAA